MLWVVLASAISAASALPTAKVASTYDEATCAEGEKARDDSEANCSEPEPVPAVLDCNDARISLWLGEMIGSCDMPRSSPSLRPARSEERLCRDGHCGVDSIPIRAAVRSLEKLPVLANTAITPFHTISSPHPSELMLRASQRGGGRLERPPRRFAD
jgi:hypothetical protein